MALELIRKKNIATIITFPLIDDDGDVVTGATGLDSEYIQYADNDDPGNWADCASESVEIGASGVYYLALSTDEVNADYIEIQIKSGNAKTQHLAIRTVSNNVVPTTTDIASAVWDYLLAGVITAGSTGELLATTFRNTFMDMAVTYATAAIVAQNITTDMANTNQCIRYITCKISFTRNFASPDLTRYLLYHYDANGYNDEIKPDTDTTW